MAIEPKVLLSGGTAQAPHSQLRFCQRLLCPKHLPPTPVVLAEHLAWPKYNSRGQPTSYTQGPTGPSRPGSHTKRVDSAPQRSSLLPVLMAQAPLGPYGGSSGLRRGTGQQLIFEPLQKQQSPYCQLPTVLVHILLGHICQGEIEDA